jgi:hypothetical protein
MKAELLWHSSNSSAMSDPVSDIAELLPEFRASFDVRDKNPEAPLHLACVMGGSTPYRLSQT